MGRVAREQFLADVLPGLRRQALFLFGDERDADLALAGALRSLPRRVRSEATRRRAIRRLLKESGSVSGLVLFPGSPRDRRTQLLGAILTLPPVERALLADASAQDVGLPQEEAARRRVSALEGVRAALTQASPPVGEGDAGAWDAAAQAQRAQPRRASREPEEDAEGFVRVRVANPDAFRRPEGPGLR
ncbi:MAG: hypothetical protein Q4B08_09545 [Propionibacteriaceae bacterium]|nr:hypothetical protein [Propionibacteriaceae bacterium]